MIDFVLVDSDELISEVVRLAQEIWTDHYVPIVGAEQIDYMLKSFQSAQAIKDQIAIGMEYRIARHDKVSAGYFAIQPDVQKGTLMLSKLYVKASLRGQGVGNAMLDFVQSLCRSRGLRTIWLTVNKNNRASIEWYIRRGFKNCGSCVQDIGSGFAMDDWRLQKNVVIGTS